MSVWWLEWEKDGNRSRLPLDRPLTIGRDTACDVYLADRTVSRRHAVATFTPNGVSIDASSSLNGVLIGGSQVRRANLLPGQQFQIAGVNFWITQTADSPAQAQAPAAPPAPAVFAPAPVAVQAPFALPQQPIAPPAPPFAPPAPPFAPQQPFVQPQAPARPAFMPVPAPLPQPPFAPLATPGARQAPIGIIAVGVLVVILVAGLVGFFVIQNHGSGAPAQSATAALSSQSASSIASPSAIPSTGTFSGDSQTTRVVAAVSPSVVFIEVSTSDGVYSGSGVIYDNLGDIITNSHVVSGASTIEVTLPNHSPQTATLIGRSTTKDIAVIRISAAGLTHATFADSSKLLVGQQVLAIGSPLQMQSTVTSGIVSALDRTVPFKDGPTLQGLIQTDAAVNPGNSGGPLVDMNGQVVGIVVGGIVPSVASGIGWAIPSNTAREVADQVIAAY